MSDTKSSTPADNNPLTRVIVNLPSQSLRDLEAHARERGLTVTGSIQSAVVLQKYLFDQIKKGSSILIETRDKKFSKIDL